MNAKTIPTTTIGSFPKPKYLPVRDWFDSARDEGGMNSPETTKQYTEARKRLDEEAELLFERAAKEIIDIQENQSWRIWKSLLKCILEIEEWSELLTKFKSKKIFSE